MTRRNKIMAIAIVIAAGGAGAWLFRKGDTPEQADPQPAAPAAAARRDAVGDRDKPPPTSHLTGRIETSADGPLDIPRSIGVAPTAAPADVSWGADSAAGTREAGRPTATLAEQARHKIADGDTLSALAQRYLGSADRYLEIFEANRDVLSDENLLPIGTELRIPARGSPLSSPRPLEVQPMVPVTPRPAVESQKSPQAAIIPTASTQPALAQPVTYRVQRRDTLSGIARQVYGNAARYPTLLDANRHQLGRPEDLREGMLLVVP